MKRKYDVQRAIFSKPISENGHSRSDIAEAVTEGKLGVN